jgi:hypothetical protein
MKEPNFGDIALTFRYLSSWIACRMAPSKRKTERMPSIAPRWPQQLGHKLPLDSGLPHLWHSGGNSRGSLWQHLAHRKSPTFPQATQRRGKKKSTTFSWSCAVNKDKAVTPKAQKEITRTPRSYARERGLGPVPLKIGSFRYTSPFLILRL